MRVASADGTGLALYEYGDPAAPVQVLAHDWGSIQAWHFVTSEQLRGRITSFVSISGPSLDHAGYFLRGRRHPAELAKQLLHSWYIFYFQLPWLPERGWRKGLGPSRLRGTRSSPRRCRPTWRAGRPTSACR